ncbi:ATP-dependent dethiobiotin synthetase BioD [Bradyrhizobium genosp. SA-3]|uniref:ATP-dependent dethiobiotin synthetase BioD n=1 Tax=Bradyrhizobium genosp. SA-3 TaxID=508868 RepID=UPI001ABFBE32|nr:ATP-dependent dethiobiotin synthetase BioD [Bradyrhizobium genosp. SA-3]
MSQRIVVTGTDTGIRRTVFSASLAHLLGANYWKPIQAGLEGETDTEVVARLGSFSADRIVPELYRLRSPASPHYSAEIDGGRIDVDSLHVPETGERPLVIEGAGGLMVPLNGRALIERWGLPVVGKQRIRIVECSTSYHGDTVGAMSVGARGVFNARVRPSAVRRHINPVPCERS